MGIEWNIRFDQNRKIWKIKMHKFFNNNLEDNIFMGVGILWQPLLSI